MNGEARMVLNLQDSLVGIWFTKLTAVLRNWHRYLAIEGVVKTYAAARDPILEEVRPENVQGVFQTYSLDVSIASSMLVTE